MFWNEHISNKLDAGKRLTMMLQVETRSNFGPKPKVMKWLYTGVVRPIVVYGALV